MRDLGEALAARINLRRKKSVVIWRTPAQLGDTLVALPAMVNIQKIHEDKQIVLVYTQSKNKNSIPCTEITLISNNVGRKPPSGPKALLTRTTKTISSSERSIM